MKLYDDGTHCMRFASSNDYYYAKLTWFVYELPFSILDSASKIIKSYEKEGKNFRKTMSISIETQYELYEGNELVAVLDVSFLA